MAVIGTALLAGAVLSVQVPLAAAAQDAAAAQSAASPAPGVSRKLAPRGLPQSWMAEDDYPAPAILEHQEGTVGFRLDVGVDGRATACTVEASSGYPTLDNHTCSLLRARALFYPALDSAGKPIAAAFRSRFHWQLPDEAVPWASWARVARFEVSKGVMRKCSVEELGTPKAVRLDMCAGLADYAPVIGEEIASAAPVWLVAIEQHEAVGQPLPRGIPAPDGPRVHRDSIAYTVAADGRILDCRNVEGEGAGFQAGGYRCHPGVRYPAASGGGMRSGKMTFVMFPTNLLLVVPVEDKSAAN